MNYLFFDIECANCEHDEAKICEFGYVKCDKFFNIIEQNNFIINPQAKFDWYVLKNLLAYTKEMYLQNKTYPEYYEQIAALFNEKDIRVIGHTTHADAGYLNDEASRFDLEPFSYEFYDVSTMYQQYTNGEHRMKLEDIANELNVPKARHLHRALDDAILTYGVAKGLAKAENLESLEDLLIEYKDLKGSTFGGELITVDGKKYMPSNNMKHGRKNYKKFIKYINETKPSGNIIESELNNKKLCVSLHYVEHHYRQMLLIAEALINRGATYCTILQDCDYFVKYDLCTPEGKIKRCNRLAKAIELNESNNKIKIIEFTDLLNLLDIKEEDLVEEVEE